MIRLVKSGYPVEVLEDLGGGNVLADIRTARNGVITTMVSKKDLTSADIPVVDLSDVDEEAPAAEPPRTVMAPARKVSKFSACYAADQHDNELTERMKELGLVPRKAKNELFFMRDGKAVFCSILRDGKAYMRVSGDVSDAAKELLVEATPRGYYFPQGAVAGSVDEILALKDR